MTTRMVDVPGAPRGKRGGIPTVTFPATGGMPWQRSRPVAAGGPPPSSTRFEFGGIYDRMGQLVNVALAGVGTAWLAELPWSPRAEASETENAYVVAAEIGRAHV